LIVDIRGDTGDSMAIAYGSTTGIIGKAKSFHDNAQTDFTNENKHEALLKIKPVPILRLDHKKEMK